MQGPQFFHDLNTRLFGEPPLRRATMPDDHDLAPAHHGLGPREGAARVLHVLCYVIDVLEVLPYEAMDARVCADGLVAAIRTLVICCWSFD